MRLQIPRRKLTLFFLLGMAGYFVPGCKKEENLVPKSTLTGFVKDEFGGSLAGVTCKLSSALGEHNATTDNAGRFEMDEVTAGKYSLSASRANYITANVSVEVTVKATTVEVVLSSGDSFLEVGDTLFTVSSVPGLKQLMVKSNTSWEVSTETSWIGLSASTGSGNGSINVNWAASDEDYSREGIVKLRSGSLSSKVRIVQEPPVKILGMEVSYGNLEVDIPDSIIANFNKVVTITSLTSSYPSCAGSFKYKLSGKRLAFTYSCGEIGGSYPLKIIGKDGQDPFEVSTNMNYYDKRRTLPGFVDDYFIAPDNEAMWAITRFPNKLVKLSLPDLAIVKELTLDFTPTVIRWNDYAQQINLFNQGWCYLETVEAGTCTQNRLRYVDPNTLSSSSSTIHHIPDYYQYGNNAYPFLYPRSIAMFDDGTGIIQLANDHEYLLWRFIDSRHGDTTFIGSIHNNLPPYDLRYQAIYESYDKSQIYLMHGWGSTKIDIYNRGQSTFQTYSPPFLGGYANKLVPHKKANFMYHAQLYEQFITDLGSYDSWYTFFDTRYFYSGFDFSYRNGEEEIVYHLGEGLLWVLDYRYGVTRQVSQFFPTMLNIQTTTDGVGMISLRQNNEGTTDVFYFPLDRLMQHQLLRTSPGGRTGSPSTSRFGSVWVKK